MAVGDAFLSAAFQVAVQLLASPIIREFGLRLGVDKDLKKLARTLSKIQSVLNDAEERQISDLAVKMWLSDLKDLAYDAEDVLDEVATEALRLNNQKNQVHNFLSLSKDFLFKQGLASKIKEINERLDEIAQERDELGLKEGVGTRPTQLGIRPQTSSLVDESCVFGRESDKKKMVELLTSPECGGNDVSIIPIVGMGGLGKTTLAQLVYNDEKVQKHFELRMWVCVSDDFDVRKLTKSIIESATRKASDLMDLDVLQNDLLERLKGKRFLLVLDDVWSERKSDWDVLRLPFRSGDSGSKIIVTTRSEKVSSIMGTMAAHRLEALSDDDCWLLFKQRAFVDGNSDSYPNLVAIGKEILKKCQGLPLAAKTLGGLLHGKEEEYEWDMILKSDIWDLREDENEILPALRLSYNYLPSHLKQCFSYCSIFPKDYEFNKEKLVLLWIAEGLVHSKGRKRIEDVGSECFDDLVLRSFFQHSKINKVQFVMHDLIHDLAQFISKEICFAVECNSSPNISEKARYVSLLVNASKPISLEVFNTSKSLRTVLILSSQYRHEIPDVKLNHDLIVSLRRLRSLYLSNVPIKDLPDSIGDLKHLRYLNVSNTKIKALPDSTCSLYNLQILILRNCSELFQLPKATTNLINLRHLSLVGCWHLASMPPEIGRLTCLQTLDRFVASKESGCGIGELKNMMQLQGSLCIDRLEDVANVTDAMEASLKNKHYLHKLALEWSCRRYLPDGIDEDVLDGLQPHANIEELKIDNYHGSKFPSWIGDSSLSHLVKIEFSHCGHCKILPSLGQLPFLKHLIIDAMYGLENLGYEFCGDGNVRGFPSLETLRLEDMKDLKEWKGAENGEFPFLHELIIMKCPKLTTLPRFPSLQDLVLDECHEKILSSFPHIISICTLKMSNFRKLMFLPEGFFHHLSALKELRIHHCYQLMTLQKVGLEDLKSLCHLEILCCPQLVDLSEGLPTTLQHLSVHVCSNLKSLPEGLQNLSSLQDLDIYKCPQLASFRSDRLPTMLKNLKISKCSNLNSLPMGLQDITTLESLVIEGCHHIISLPEEGLPISLHSLMIRECEILEKRCQEGGEDWAKISHIPRIHIGNF
ncbi:putative disease resistance protein RGA3 [Telopea speciosissima]|uniref:putative disease resistance protein RGA3 n=1 Tax=Telopea speciosissima TaxID=54955 RepID=UPI001CC39810|nr:putative disease resistance protein RGA3 [Telopea speciosissima]